MMMSHITINFAFADVIPREGLECQFQLLLLRQYQITDYLNRGFEHKDKITLTREKWS